MSTHQFLTLEGRPERRRKARPTRALSGPPIGAPLVDRATADARIAAQRSAAAAKQEAEEEGRYRDYTAADSSKQGAKRAELFKYGSFDLKENAPSLFAHYGIEGLGEYSAHDLGELALFGLVADGLVPPQNTGPAMLRGLGTLAAYALSGVDFIDEDDGTLGFWGRLKRMFTPPRSVRQIFSEAYRSVSKVKVAQALRPITKMKMPAVMKKVVKYAGAINTLPLTLASGKLRNQVFGLKGAEIAMFDKAAKIGRIGAVAVASVVGAPALAGAMGPKAGLLMGKMGTSFLGKGVGGKLASFIIKDAAKSAIWRVTKDAAGKLIGEKFNKDQIPPEEYAAIPEDMPVPSATPPELISLPPSVAGTGGMMPDTTNSFQEGARYGEAEGQSFSDEVRDQSRGQMAEDRLNSDDRLRYLSPATAEDLADRISGDAGGPSDIPLKELIAQEKLRLSTMKAQDALESEVDDDGQPTLHAQAAFIRRRKRQLTFRPAIRQPSMEDIYSSSAAAARKTREEEAARIARLALVDKLDEKGRRIYDSLGNKILY